MSKLKYLWCLIVGHKFLMPNGMTNIIFKPNKTIKCLRCGKEF